MSVLFVPNIVELSSLRKSSEKPENHILKPAVAATAYDKELYKRVIHYLNPSTGPGSLIVIFSITKGQKNGVDTLFRHASFHDPAGEPIVDLVAMCCRELGFEGGFSNYHLERHPQNPNIIAVFQEFK